MSRDVVIRDATLDDVETIARFNMRMAQETEGQTLDADTIRRGVRGLIAHPERGRYLLAAESSSPSAPPIGQLMLTYEWSDWRAGCFWWIQSVFVEKVARRRGVYRALHARVVKLARDDGGVCGIRLYVESENHIAQQTYRALGMRPTHYLMFETERWPDTGPDTPPPSR